MKSIHIPKEGDLVEVIGGELDGFRGELLHLDKPNEVAIIKDAKNIRKQVKLFRGMVSRLPARFGGKELVSGPIVALKIIPPDSGDSS